MHSFASQTVGDDNDVKPTPLPDPKEGKFGAQTAWNGKDELVHLEHILRPLPRIPLSGWYKPDNWKYRTGQLPFILTEVTKQESWNASVYSQWGPEYLARKFPTSMVSCVL
jgi:hypothetical protein